MPGLEVRTAPGARRLYPIPYSRLRLRSFTEPCYLCWTGTVFFGTDYANRSGRQLQSGRPEADCAHLASAFPTTLLRLRRCDPRCSLVLIGYRRALKFHRRRFATPARASSDPGCAPLLGNSADHIRGTRKNRDMVEAVRHVRITDDAYVLRSQTETQTSLVEWKWDRFKRFREDENAFCFHLRGGTGRTFEYLPKHWLKDHQVDELRSFLRSAIASGK
jgi:hypothetical protein